MTKDVTMTDVDAGPVSPRSPRENAPKELTDEEKQAKQVKTLKHCVSLIERCVGTKETRYLSRALRQYAGIRHKVNAAVLNHALRGYYPTKSTRMARLTALVPTTATLAADDEKKGSAGKITPEVDVFMHLIVLMHLLDTKNTKGAHDVATLAIAECSKHNRRTLDPLNAKAWYYYAYTCELVGKSAESRPQLLAAYRTASLHHDYLGQAVLINTLLRSYLSENLYDQADKLIAKSKFPESASNNQFARFLYYKGRIRAIQLDYTDGFNCFLQAIRKAPTNTAVGFRTSVTKFGVVVKLLMGDIPIRSTFRQEALRSALLPYFELTQAVRKGDLAAFKEVRSRHAKTFIEDGTFTLIVRLRRNVIKTALRKINLSYSRISLKEVASKLKLDSVEETESVVAKAIADGVIEATIDHTKGFLASKDVVDVYSSNDPQSAYHERISFCLNVHNDAVKAMRFPKNAHKTGFESAEDRKRREAEEAELAREIAEEEDEL